MEAAIEIRNWTTFGNKNWYDEIENILKIVKISGQVKIYLTSSTYLATDIHRLMSHFDYEKAIYGIKLLSELKTSNPRDMSNSEARCYVLIEPK